METTFTRRIAKRSLVLIFVVAMVFRLAISMPRHVQLSGDQLYYDNTAWNLANGRGFTAVIEGPPIPSIIRTPGYPALLSVIYRIFGHSIRAGLVLQAIIDSATAVVVALVANEVLAGTYTLIAGLLYALFPYAALLAASLSQDQLACFGVVLSLWILLRILQHPDRPVGWVMLGLTVGLTAMVKPFLILWYSVPLLMLICTNVPWRTRIRSALLSSCAIVLVITPWVVRNYREFHAFPPLASGGPGPVMEVVLQEMDGGETSYAFALRENWNKLAGSQADYRSDVFVDGGAMLAKQREWESAAMRRIVHRLPEYLLLVARHVPRLWLTMFSVDRPAWQLASAFGLSVFVLVFGALGIFFSRNAWRELLPVYATMAAVTFSYAFYIPEARYTLPARACMMLFIAAAVREYWMRVALKRNRAASHAASFAGQ